MRNQPIEPAGLPDEAAGNRRIPGPFVPPQASDASREIVVPAKGSLRGALVTRGSSPKIIRYESNLEKRVLLVLLARRDIVDVREQIEPIAYKDEFGAKRRHWFDFLALRSDGLRVLIPVKTEDWARRHDLEGLCARIARYVPRSLADVIVPMTERDAPRDLVRDAELFHCVRDDDRPDHDRIVFEIASSLIGTTTVACLVEASGLGGEGFRAIARLIQAGTLRVVSRGSIDYASRVSFVDDEGRVS